MERTTLFSPCRQYRYTLWRTWDMFNESYLQVVGLNPSTADETLDDPTIRRCIGFAKHWGYGALCMTNLFAYRSTDPHALRTVDDPIGPENDAYLSALSEHASLVLAAWGTHGVYRWRDDAVMKLLAVRPLVCLGTNKDGTPKHPLYVAKDRAPLAYPTPDARRLIF